MCILKVTHPRAVLLSYLLFFERLIRASFDTASLAILDKLNIIEDLLRKPNPTPPVSVQPLSPLKSDNNAVQTPASVPSVLSAVAPEKPVASTRRRMSIETVLSWTAFAAQAPNLDLKGLLVSTDVGNTGHTVPTDFMNQTENEEQLLQRFLDNVFIYNPILEESALQQCLREIQYQGLKWDVRSCLVVGF